MTPDLLKSIHHDGSPRYVRSLRRDPLLGDEVTLRLRCSLDLAVQRILLRLCPDGEQQFIEMAPEPQPNPACRWWQTTIRLAMPLTGYRFLLFLPDGVWWYNGGGLQRGLPADAQDFRLLAGYQAPEWVRSSVFYQVFPDRFADGEPHSNVRDGEFEYMGHPARARRWDEPPGSGRASLVEFYGGDLPGITAHLPEILDLGANALYLNPVFSAFSNHRYDVTDYDNVDPHLGGNSALAELRRAAAALEMRYILDIVPNHCGVLHPWFSTAQADANAPSAEFFTFFNHPHDYAAWLGVRSLPKLNYRSTRLRAAMYAGPDSIFRRWLRPPYAIDGWRLDVANMLARQGADQLGYEVGRGIRQAVKEENPQAYILGENFFDGTDQLQGDLWDATMNYSGFAKPLWFWLDRFQVGSHGMPGTAASDAPWPAEALVESWEAFRAGIPWALASQQFNLLGSHDTPRILEKVKGDPALNRLAVAILLTYLGVPSIYYGDEIGLGARPNEMRAPMPWERAAWDLDLRAFYQQLVHLRRTSPALIEGGLQVLYASGDGLAYLRDSDAECLLLLGQRRAGGLPADGLPVAHGAIHDGSQWQELFSGRWAQVQGGRLLASLPGAGVQLWRWQP